MSNKRAIGSHYEREAIHYLEKHGYSFICKNYFTPSGEIDLVFSKDEKLYFIEVKYRSSDAFGSPREAITKSKMAHMKLSAMHYLKHECPFYTPYAIAFMGILKDADTLKFDFLENIFS